MAVINVQEISLYRCISYYLIESYRYYISNEPNYLSDHQFDAMCKRMAKNWRQLRRTDHQHKHLVKLKALKAGTGFSINPKEYPLIVRSIGSDPKWVEDERHLPKRKKIKRRRRK